MSCKALASNLAADHEIRLTQAGHAAMGFAPALVLDPLQDKEWDYSVSAGSGLGCIKCVEEYITLATTRAILADTEQYSGGAMVYFTTFYGTTSLCIYILHGQISLRLQI